MRGLLNSKKTWPERNKIGFKTFDKAKKNNLTENKPDDDKDQALESAKEEEKSTELRKDMIL